ncbi:MAG: GAF domain-containing SpoIIE family protein phosphatase [Ignavibacteriaceae bacterium]
MDISKNKINENFSWWLIGALVFSIIFYRILFFSSNSHFFFIINDLVVFTLVAITVLVIIKKIKLTNPLPSALVLNSGIIVAFIFLVILFAEQFLNALFQNSESISTNPDLFQNIILSFYSLMFLVITSYWFATLKELYFYKRYSSKSSYFYLMVAFMIAASISSLVFRGENYDYINNAFEIITVFLICFNSLKISWIAFISKKDKVSLLILSIIISALFIINFANSGQYDFNGKILANFSPVFHTFYKFVLLYGGIYFAVLFFTTLFHIPTAEAYDRKAKEVSSLQYFSKLITQVLDFEELAETITDIATKVSSADAAWIVLKNGNELKTIANKNIAFVDADIINNYLLKSGLCENIIETKICSLDKYKYQLNLSEKFGNVAVSPLKSLNETKGYLIAAKKNELIFYDEDKTAINTFADYASVAFENSILLEKSIEKERLEKELDVARDIQQKILPAKDPKFYNLDITSVFIPAFEVGGDYYDYFEISKNKFGFIIADVSGKGISASFIMAEVKGIFSSLSQIIENPKDILIKANEVLQRTLNKKYFVSVLYGVFDYDKGRVRFARAGHCPALLVRDNYVQTFRPSGIALGLTDNLTFKENLDEITLDLKNDDTLVFYTDGITEAKNPELEDFGEKRFSEILVSFANNSVDKIANEVIKDVTLFSQNHSQYDDITLVILKWHKKNNLDGVKEWLNSTPQLKNKVL